MPLSPCSRFAQLWSRTVRLPSQRADFFSMLPLRFLFLASYMFHWTTALLHRVGCMCPGTWTNVTLCTLASSSSLSNLFLGLCLRHESLSKLSVHFLGAVSTTCVNYPPSTRSWDQTGAFSSAPRNSSRLVLSLFPMFQYQNFHAPWFWISSFLPPIVIYHFCFFSFSIQDIIILWNCCLCEQIKVEAVSSFKFLLALSMGAH